MRRRRLIMTLRVRISLRVSKKILWHLKNNNIDQNYPYHYMMNDFGIYFGIKSFIYKTRLMIFERPNYLLKRPKILILIQQTFIASTYLILAPYTTLFTRKHFCLRMFLSCFKVSTGKRSVDQNSISFSFLLKDISEPKISNF